MGARAFREKVIISGIDDVKGWAWIPVPDQVGSMTLESRWHLFLGKKVLLLLDFFFLLRFERRNDPFLNAR